MDKRLIITLGIFCLLFSQIRLFGSTEVSTSFIENRGQCSRNQALSPEPILFYAKLPQIQIFVHPHALSFVVQNGSTAHSARLNLLGSIRDLRAEPAHDQSMIRFVSQGVSYECLRTSTLRFKGYSESQDLLVSLESSSLVLRLVSSNPLNSAHPSNPLPLRCSWSEAQMSQQSDSEILVSLENGTPLFPWRSQLSGPRLHRESPKEAWVEWTSADANSGKSLAAPLSGSSRVFVQATIELSSYLGGSGVDSCTAGTPVVNGMLVCGASSSPNFPTSSGTQQSSLNGPRDAFVSRFDASGHRMWSTYFGSSGDEIAQAICISAGKVYVCGRTTSASGMSTSGSFQSSFGGGSSDCFVACFDDVNGKLLSCTYYGGNEADEARAICVLPNGSIAVAGTTFSSDLKMNGQQSTFNAPSDAFALVLNPGLTAKTWSTYYGGRSYEEGRIIGAMSDGSVLLGGNTSSANSGAFIAANIGEGSTPPGGLQASGFLTRLDANGMRTWGRYVGGDHYDTLTCIVVANDNIFLGGYTNSTTGASNNFMTGGSAQSNFNGGNSDAFVCRLDAQGVHVWGSYLGGTNDDRCLALYVNSTMDVMMCGTTSSSDFPQTKADSVGLKGSSDAFVAFFISNGTKVMASTVFGGSADDYACALAQQADGSLLIGGSTTSSDFATLKADQTSSGGSMDAFVRRYQALYVVGVEDGDIPVSDGSLYPNPCDKQCTVLLPESVCINGSELQVYSCEGKRVPVQSILSSGANTIIETSTLPNGLYLLRILSASGILSKSFVVQH